MRGVSLVRDGRTLVNAVDWTIEPAQRWVVMGPNGCGKTTLCRIAALQLHPSSGSLRLFGEELGSFDVRQRRKRIGFVSAAMANQIRPALSAADVVMCAKFAALEPWWHEYSGEDRELALLQLARMGLGPVSEHAFGSLSSGERQRCLLARALMVDPDLLVLDEPNAGLDLGGREELIMALDSLHTGEAQSEDNAPAVVLVTHHVEEIPPSFERLLLMRQGTAVASGELDSSLNAESLSNAFGLGVELATTGSGASRRWSARAVAFDEGGQTRL
jgi:iron complex transport system ATP-binding protein